MSSCLAAHLLFDRRAKDLIHILLETGQDVNPRLYELAESSYGGCKFNCGELGMGVQIDPRSDLL